MSTATRDAIKSDTTSEVTRDLKDKLVIQDDALSVVSAFKRLPLTEC